MNLSTTSNWRRPALPLLVLAGWLLAAISPSSSAAQTAVLSTGLRPPGLVVLYQNTSLGYTDFVQPLACMLQKVLRAGVVVKDASVVLGPDMMAAPAQYSTDRVLAAFYSNVTKKDPPTTFSFLLVSEDLKAEPFHYVFSTNDGNAQTSFHVGVLSTSRLDPGDGVLGAKERADLTALRAYKLILKAVARLSGYGIDGSCVLVFPRSLPELDAKSDRFCPTDQAALVSAGMLKPKEDRNCLVISDIDERKLASR